MELHSCDHLVLLFSDCEFDGRALSLGLNNSKSPTRQRRARLDQHRFVSQRMKDGISNTITEAVIPCSHGELIKIASREDRGI